MKHLRQHMCTTVNYEKKFFFSLVFILIICPSSIKCGLYFQLVFPFFRIRNPAVNFLNYLENKFERTSWIFQASHKNIFSVTYDEIVSLGKKSNGAVKGHISRGRFGKVYEVVKVLIGFLLQWCTLIINVFFIRKWELSYLY